MGRPTVLVANRGEIAVRILRTLREMGFPTVAVYSEADREAPHVHLADQAVHIGPAPPQESYLNIPALLEAAERTGATVIHPGYGFLSENPAFAKAVQDSGRIFVGPTPETLATLGDKRAARALAEQEGVPLVPGSPALTDVEEVQAWAERIGYPVLLKAVGGGGGKGMRKVMHPDELPAAAESAMREAEAAFGDPRLFVEKWVEPAHHVEVQILGLPDGTVVALGERECSLQRRYQKIVEESPSPFVTPDLREQLMEAAVRVARAAGYRNAGTVEFLVDREGGFYFMEVNARLQVEHPVTEMVLGLDLVRLQMEVALDESLSLPSRREPRGHAMEARLYAEDPTRQFLPQTGRLIEVSFPFRPGVRVDHGLVEGMEISPHYDPLLAKIIAWGMDREQARRRLLQALQETVVFGVQTNLNYLQDLLASGAFRSGETYTQTVANLPPAAPTPEEVVAAAWVAWHAGHGQSTRPRFTENREAELWDRLRGRWMP